MKILGIGNALVDIMIITGDEKILEMFSLPKGSMQLVDHLKANEILHFSEGLPRTISAGGSSANTINGLSNLGVNTGFIGMTGSDHFGTLFSDDLKMNRILPSLFNSSSESGRALAIVTPDSERTFATYLGAAIELDDHHITPELFKCYQMIHVEGYLVQNRNLFRKILEVASGQSLLISLDLASYNVVEQNLDFITEMVRNYVDIVFANEEEARAFTGKGPEEAVEVIASFTHIAVVKKGKDGSLIRSGGRFENVPAMKADVVDTTGAGDLYAAGFLYGLSKGLSLRQCGMTGSVCAGKVIEVFGSKLGPEDWNSIKEQINGIEKELVSEKNPE